MRFSIGRRKWQVASARTGGEDDILRGQLFGLAVFGDGQFVGGGQLAVAHMDGDLVLLHQMRDALIQLLGNPTRPLHHRVDIRADIRRRQAIIARMLHIMIDFGRTQQRLGRDAAPVEANAAEIFALNNRDLQPKLRCTDGGNIATGATAEDD